MENKLSPRHGPVVKARNDLMGFMLQLRRTYQLTEAEEVFILAEQVREFVAQCVSSEREGCDA